MILGVPTGGNIKPPYFDAAVRDLKTGIIHDYISAWSIYLETNRRNITSGFMDHFPKEELLLQVDDDIFWDKEVLPTLLKWLAVYDVVFPDLPLGIAPTNALKWNGAEFQPWWPHDSKPFEADGVAGAMFVVKRSVLELMPFGTWFERRKINGSLAGEDTSFSYRLRELDIKPFCVPGLPIIHYRTTPLVSPLVDQKYFTTEREKKIR